MSKKNLIFKNLFEIREKLKYQIANGLHNEFVSLYDNLTTLEYSLDYKEIMKRDLRNKALSYLVVSQPKEYHKKAYEQYTTANNMTDAQASLIYLITYPGEYTKIAIEHFYNKWHNYFLLLCRWFALQSLSTDDMVVERLKELSQHELFKVDNPNMNNAIFRTFAQSNLVQFHSVTGNGYKFIANQVIANDKFNTHFIRIFSKIF